MEIYAGFAEHTDYHAGRFVDALEEMGILDNTLIFYIAGDNGASAEGLMTGTYNEMLTLNYVPDTVENILAHYDDLGTVAAYNHYPVGWAHAMDTPYQWTKQVASHWGGTRNGMAVRWPKGIRAKGQVRSQFHHVIDIAPTILEAAGLPQPVQVHGVTQKPIEGVSMAYTFDDAKAADKHVTQYFEMFGNRGIYHEGWSAVCIHHSPFVPDKRTWEDDVWELYDGSTDWSQAVNVADKYPDKLDELKDLFMVEAAKFNVFPLDDRRTELMNPEIAGRPDLLNGRTAMTFYSGMGQLMENTVPNVKNKSHTITADIEVPEEDANGVIIAQGGRFGGWSLYVKDGVLKYVHNYVGIEEYPVVATEPLPAGRVKVQYKFTYEGGEQTGAGGTGALYVGNKKVGEAHIDKTVPFQFSLDETLDIGRDLGHTGHERLRDGQQRLQRHDPLGEGRRREGRRRLLRAAGEHQQPPVGAQLARRRSRTRIERGEVPAEAVWICQATDGHRLTGPLSRPSGPVTRHIGQLAQEEKHETHTTRLLQGGGRRNGARRAERHGSAGAGSGQDGCQEHRGAHVAVHAREMASALLARLQADEVTDPLAAQTVEIAPNMETGDPARQTRRPRPRRSWRTWRRRPGKSRTSWSSSWTTWATATSASTAAACCPARPRPTSTAWDEKVCISCRPTRSLRVRPRAARC